MVKNSADPPTGPLNTEQYDQPDTTTSVTEEKEVTTEAPSGEIRKTRSIRRLRAEEDRNLDGIPDKLESFLTNSDFRLDWTKRRALVYKIVVGMGVLYTLLIGAIAYLMLWEKTLDNNLEGLVSTAMWTLSTTFVAIVMSYVFGAQIDASSYRSSVNDIIGKLSAAKRPTQE